MENRFKRSLAAGQVQYGLWLGLSDPYGSEIAAGSGFDWLLIDGEHAPNDLRAVLGQLQVIAAYPDTHPVVRPVEGDPALLKQLLDIGCQTLLVPMIESAEQAAAMVAAVRYPPQGIRGVGTALARASRWGTTPDYLQRANDEVCLLLQVESVTGLQALEAIATTQGVDGVFIGPADLAASMGHLGNPAHPEVKAAVINALRTIARLGKAPGILTADPALVEAYREAGALFIAVGVDTVLLAKATRALAATYKSGQ